MTSDVRGLHQGDNATWQKLRCGLLCDGGHGVTRRSKAASMVSGQLPGGGGICAGLSECHKAQGQGQMSSDEAPT